MGAQKGKISIQAIILPLIRNRLYYKGMQQKPTNQPVQEKQTRRNLRQRIWKEMLQIGLDGIGGSLILCT